jgi:hypothetical protein
MTAGQDDLITFYRVLPGLAPRRGMPCAMGTLPTRAFQYCEPSRLASALGYYAFLPMTFQVEWDGGTGGLWSFDDGASWYPLTTAAFPDSMASFDAIAPEGCKGFCPPFLTLGEVPGILQVWTGWFARTAPGYSLLVKRPANLGRAAPYEVLEGVVETDRWFGPLFANVRLQATGVPILFDGMAPFLQVLPLHRAAYAEEVQNRFSVQDAAAMPAELWTAYERSLIDPVMRNPERGHYAKAVRRRRAAEGRGCPEEA